MEGGVSGDVKIPKFDVKIPKFSPKAKKIVAPALGGPEL